MITQPRPSERQSKNAAGILLTMLLGACVLGGCTVAVARAVFGH